MLPPFIVLLLLVPCIAVCGALAAWCARRRQWRAAAVLFVPALAAMLLLGVSLAAWRVELTRPIAKAQLVGEWRYEGHSVRFAGDGSFSAGDGTHGRWELSDGSPFVVVHSINALVPDQCWWGVHRGNVMSLVHDPRCDADPDGLGLHAAYSRVR